MGAPNLLQQLYLKTALNESKDGMFDHPADLEEGYQRKRMSVIRKAISSTGSGDRSQMKPEVADFLERSFKKKRMRNKVLSGGKGEVAALMVRARKKTAALKAKGLAEQSITEGLLSKLERLDEGYTSRGGYSKSMTSRILRDNSRSPENRAARAAARAAALKAAAARAAAAKTPDTKN